MSAEKPSIERVIEFHELLDTFAGIERIIHIKRRGEVMLESDTEHSYNLAMTSWFLSGYFPELDQNKVIKLALVHDVVEVHAGDTFIFDEPEMLASKKDRETAAQERLAEEWPDFPSLHQAMEEYENRESPESQFVYALDKLMPMITIYLNEGMTWREKQMKLEEVAAQKMAKTEISPDVNKYWQDLHKILLEQPELFG